MAKKDLRYCSRSERLLSRSGYRSASSVELFENKHGDDFGIYHPLSYYVAGGIDVDGSELRTDASISYDDSKDIDGGCSPDALCDPRTSYFDIVEELGAELAKAVTEDAAADDKK